MLSAAKHLLFLVRNKQKQILRFAQDDRIEAFRQPEAQRLDLFLFSPFKAILTTRVTVKFGSQGIGENRRDLPACCCTSHRKVDGFIGNLTEQSQGARVAQTPLLGLQVFFANRGPKPEVRATGSAARGAGTGVQPPQIKCGSCPPPVVVPGRS